MASRLKFCTTRSRPAAPCASRSAGSSSVAQKRLRQTRPGLAASYKRACNAVGDEFGVAPDSAGHDRQARRHRLQDRIGNAFVERGQREHVEFAHQLRRVAASARKRTPADWQTELGRQRLEIARSGPSPTTTSREVRRQLRLSLPNRPRRVQQRRLVLDRVEAADRADREQDRIRPTVRSRRRCVNLGPGRNLSVSTPL